MSDTIIAIDLGRYNCVACVYHRITRVHSFRTLDTTPADLDKLLAQRHCGVADLGRTNGRRGGSDRWGRARYPLGAPVTSDSRVRSSRCCGRQMRRMERNPSCGRGRG